MMRRRWIATLPIAAAGGVLALWAARVRQEHALESLWNTLQAPGSAAETFDPAMVDGLPEPAQRYLRHAIAPGTPLARSVTITMHGTLRLSPGGEALPMRAEQVLAPPAGFIWRARVGRGLMRFRGFDRYGNAQGGMRWWMLGLVPIVRAGGADVTRSAAGRLGGEAVLVPGALLPGRGAVWEAVDDSTARVRLVVDGEPVTTTLRIDADGRLRHASLMRWRDDAGGGGAPGFVRFDVELSGERTFGGYTVPAHLRAGWRLGEPDEFPFYDVTVDTAEYR
jgi:hypothetical protein